MIKKIDLYHFKCFESLKLPLAELTLLSGSNASGKSSILQALVLLHQTISEFEWSSRLMLNGESIKLGTVSDVVDKVNGRHSFGIGLSESGVQYEWSFSGERADMSTAVDSITIDGVVQDDTKFLQYLLPYKQHENSYSLVSCLHRMTYITAERVGPREFYSLQDRQSASVVGPAGDKAISVLHLGREEKVLENLVITSAPPTRLRQVEARMESFFPGCGIIVQQVPQTNAVTLGIRTSEDTDFHRPVHVGFGLTQVLPIVVAALSAEKGDILLIENPEVHLHPAGQSQMGQFLAEVASAGVQVILETHSDHVLNGIRRSVKAKKIQSDQVAMHFFVPRSTSSAQVFTMHVDDSGNVDAWPPGFFDQFDKDMNYFAGWEQ